MMVFIKKKKRKKTMMVGVSRIKYWKFSINITKLPHLFIY